MLSSLVDEVDKSGTATNSLSTSAAEGALVIAAKNGNERAFETLVERYRRRMLAVALRFTHVQEDAEDVTQQSFQKAFVYLQTFEGKSSFSTWLTRITVNQALMLLRRARGRREISIDGEPSELKRAACLQIPDPDPDPEACCLQRDEGATLSAAMNTLAPGLRTTIELRDLAELSTEETARRMGLSVGAVKSRRSRARRKLRDALRGSLRSRRIPEAVSGEAKRISRDRLVCTACD